MPSHNHIHIDDSLWPLLIVRYTGTPSTRQFEESLARRTSYLERGQRHVTLLDFTGATGLSPPEQRHMQVDWLKQHDARLREQSLGEAFVTDSTVMKLLLSVILHLKPLSSPHQTFRQLPEALAWCAERLEQAGLAAEARRVREHLEPRPGKRSA